MQTGYKVIDAMTKRPLTAAPEDSLRRIAELMREHDVGSLLLKQGEELVGIITEWDVVRRVVAPGLDAAKTPASKIMTPARAMATASPGMDIFDALKMMRERDVRHLPVLDEGRLVGFITLKDILKIQPELFELIAEKYEIREAERKPLSSERAKSGDCDLCKNYSEQLREVRGVIVCPDCVDDVEE